METSPMSNNVRPLRTGAERDTPLRTPPHNYEAEQALLGAILGNNLVFDKVNEILRPEHFADAVHGRIYEAIGKLVQRGQIANLLTLKNIFDQDPGLADAGGGKYLERLASSLVTIVNAEDYARTIHDLHIRRELIDLGEEVVNEAYGFDADETASDQIERAEQKLYGLSETGLSETGLRPFEESLTKAIDIAAAAYKRDSHVTGVTTGLTDLDRMLGGLHPSDLVILAGRPSMGKTALATNMAFNAAQAFHESGGKDGGKVAIFSLEMSSEQLATRILAQQTGISSDRIRRGEIRTDDFTLFSAVLTDLQHFPFFIDDTPAITISTLRTRARRLKRQHGLGLIMVDYLQLMRPSSINRNDNRVQEISEITRGLKAIAKELNVPVLALSQLSRAVEQRDDKRPQLADLRESGSIEQDADVVMFIYREDYYHLRKKPHDGSDDLEKWKAEADRIHNLAEIIVAKQRHGPIGNVQLFFNGMVTKFTDYVRDDHLPHGDH
jgi:replicative DNA helicase